MQIVTNIFTCNILRLMGHFQQAGMAPWRTCKVDSWSQTLSFSVTWPSWASCACAEGLSFSVFQKKVGEMRHQQSVLKVQCSFPWHHWAVTVDAGTKEPRLAKEQGFGEECLWATAPRGCTSTWTPWAVPSSAYRSRILISTFPLLVSPSTLWASALQELNRGHVFLCGILSILI